MRIRPLSQKARTRFLASGLFLIGLSSTASLLTPVEQPGAQVLPESTLAADVTWEVRNPSDCPSAG